jgi:DNA (cytosine-5)-methyltransferase 1
MDLLKMNKTQLLEKCAEFGIIKCSSKNKTQLIELIQSHSESKQESKPESIPIQEESIQTKENQLKFIDLFCGIGGFHQALKNLDGECVFACDIDANCRKTYETNYGLKPESDITKVNINAIPDFDVLCGGFPCQPFSKAGFQMGFDDPSGRGNLFFNICAIVNRKKPKYLILENVRNLASHDDGNTWKVIYKSLDNLGYYTYEWPVILNVLHFNVPQNRERVIIMCKRKDLGPLPTLPKIPKSYKKTLTTSISNFISLETEESETKKYKITGKMKEVETVWNEFIDLLLKNQIAMPKFPIWSDWWDNEYVETDPFYKKYTSWIDKNRAFYTVNKAILQPWLTKSREERTEWKGAVRKFEWQAGDLKATDSLNTMLWTARGSGIRVKQCDYIPTLVAMAMIPVYGPESRKLTPRELLRLQSFPDTFIYDAKHIGKQVGNAVNVKMIERCAKFLILDEPLF